MLKAFFLKREAFNITLATFSFVLQKELLHNEQCTFEELKEKIDYRKLLGAGAYGKCYLAAVKRVDTKEERVFCIKEVWPKSMETSAPWNETQLM